MFILSCLKTFKTVAMKISILILAFVIFCASLTAASDVDVCIQQKLKLPTPVNHQTILRDIEEGNFKRFRYAARSALQICHPTFDIVAGQIFKKMMKPQVALTEVELKCYETYLLKKNPEGLLIPQLDKNLLTNGFDGSENCDGIINAYVQLQIKHKMPEGTESELKCLNNLIDRYMSGRIKALVMSRGGYSYEIFNDERSRFVRELRDVSDELIECIVGA